mmetsp:Transcript_4367/g.11255  ORF Transcript_4367/g.11255 Transcript_4367/m.11255 type:complete len:200 (-) Transcript_4367:868-1467(-)
MTWWMTAIARTPLQRTPGGLLLIRTSWSLSALVARSKPLLSSEVEEEDSSSSPSSLTRAGHMKESSESAARPGRFLPFSMPGSEEICRRRLGCGPAWSPARSLSMPSQRDIFRCASSHVGASGSLATVACSRFAAKGVAILLHFDVGSLSILLWGGSLPAAEPCELTRVMLMFFISEFSTLGRTVRSFCSISWEASRSP